MTDVNDEIIKRLDRQDETLKDLTKSINEFAQIVARKEVQDEHFSKQIEDLTNRANNHAKRLQELEKVAAGDAARQKIQDWVWRAVIGLVVTAAGGGIVWAVAQNVTGG